MINIKEIYSHKISCHHFLCNLFELLIALFIIHNSDCQRATWTFGDFLSVSDLFESYLELVSTWTGVEKGCSFGIKVQVLNFDFIIDFS